MMETVYFEMCNNPDLGSVDRENIMTLELFNPSKSNTETNELQWDDEISCTSLLVSISYLTNLSSNSFQKSGKSITSKVLIF